MVKNDVEVHALVVEHVCPVTNVSGRMFSMQEQREDFLNGPNSVMVNNVRTRGSVSLSESAVNSPRPMVYTSMENVRSVHGNDVRCRTNSNSHNSTDSCDPCCYLRSDFDCKDLEKELHDHKSRCKEGKEHPNESFDHVNTKPCLVQGVHEDPKAGGVVDYFHTCAEETHPTEVEVKVYENSGEGTWSSNEPTNNHCTAGGGHDRMNTLLLAENPINESTSQKCTEPRGEGTATPDTKWSDTLI